MSRPSWRLLALLKLLLLAQPIVAQLAPREPLALLAGLQGRRLFGPAAAAAKPALLPENRVDAAEVLAAVTQFAELLYDPGSLTLPATAAHPRPQPIPMAALVESAHLAALHVLARHARQHARHPFHSPEPLLPPAFHGDACAALLVARGLALTAGDMRAAALLLERSLAACPSGYAADFTASLCAARPALRATPYCTAAAPAPGWRPDWSAWPTWAKVSMCAVGATAVVAASAVALSVAAGTAAIEAGLPAAYEGSDFLETDDLHGLQQALSATGLGISYSMGAASGSGVLVGGALI